ncbi:arylformamidase [Bacillus sp. DJP31]|uniref:arylformamidase n=1 Tax=Bacillus sp. DJP31 TaxID=3409789 RepID=UPI003BB51FBC
MNWIDISQTLHSKTAVWPGDTPFTFSLNWSKQETGSVNVGKIEMSTHTGTHIDAPFHFDNEGKKVLDLDLTRYIGRAILLDVSNRSCIKVEDIENASLEDCKIVLLKTMSWKDRSLFPENITYIEMGVAENLSKRGVKLIGVDVPSVDPLDSKQLIAHHELAFHDIHILEGLVLDEVQEGLYELIALPLPIKDADASPVRAVIREI